MPAEFVARRDPGTLGAKVSPRFRGLLKVLTAADPAQRYRDYVEFLEDVEGVRAAGAGPEEEKTLLYPNDKAGPKRAPAKCPPTKCPTVC